MGMTPSIRQRGRYTLKLPWVADPGKIYECEAIRSFDDLAKLNVDVYETFYLPAGLQNGQVYAGVPFSFESEKSADANIVTLRSQDGDYIYVPDTYILSLPDMSGVHYDQIVLSMNLGAVPAYLDLSALKTDVGNLAEAMIGKDVTVLEHRAPSTNQPTAANHDVMEAARTAAISITKTHYVLWQEEIVKNAKLQDTVNALVAKLQALGEL